jgi:RND family efflux transporter MFP subunit
MNVFRPALLACLVLAAACSKPELAADTPRPVLTQTVLPGAAAPRDLYSGEIRARYEADVGFRVGGKLVARLVDAGARVRKGQVLARLDPEDAALAAQAARAQHASAQADLTLAKAERDRHADLLAKHFISQSAFDAKENAYQSAVAKLEQAKSQAAITSNQAAYTTLVADGDGVIISVAAEPGQVLAAGQPVVRLAYAGEKEVVLNAPEGQLARFATGQAVAISLWSDPGVAFAGRVREIAGGADPVTRTYTVRVTALNPPGEAQLGMTANVLFPSRGEPDLVVLPMAALTKQGDAPAVWVIEGTDRVKLRPVTVGQYREDGVSIIAGLHAGDVVVTAGVHKLRAGQVVRVATLPSTAQAAR